MCPCHFSEQGTYIFEFVQAPSMLRVSLSYVSPVASGRHCFIAVIHSHQLLEFFCLLFCTVPWTLRGESLKKTSYLRLSVTKTCFLHIVLVWIRVSSHLLQEEAILTFESVEIVVWSYLQCCLSFSKVIFLIPNRILNMDKIQTCQKSKKICSDQSMKQININFQNNIHVTQS